MQIIRDKKKSLLLMEDFIKNSGGLVFTEDPQTGDISIHQKQDKKFISFHKEEMENVLYRINPNKESFLQVNFSGGKRILLTNHYIGFAPAACEGLDPSKLPKVVTTPDLLSVIEAIESSLYGEDRYEEKLEDVKLFFESMSCGAEAVGFNLTGERLWVERLFATYPVTFKKAVY